MDNFKEIDYRVITIDPGFQSCNLEERHLLEEIDLSETKLVWAKTIDPGAGLIRSRSTVWVAGGRSSTFCIWRQELHCTQIRFLLCMYFWDIVLYLFWPTPLLSICAAINVSIYFWAVVAFFYIWVRATKHKWPHRRLSHFSSDHLYVPQLQLSTLQVIYFYIWRLFWDGDRAESAE